MAAFVEAAPDAPQYMTALARANRARLAAAEIKREVREGRTSVRAALYDDRSGSVTVLELLMQQRRWGRTRAVKALSRLDSFMPGGPCRVPENKRVSELTDRQRTAIARMTAAASPPTG